MQKSYFYELGVHDEEVEEKDDEWRVERDNESMMPSLEAKSAWQCRNDISARHSAHAFSFYRLRALVVPPCGLLSILIFEEGFATNPTTITDGWEET